MREGYELVLEELIGLPGRLGVMWLVRRGLKLGANCYIVPSVMIERARRAVRLSGVRFSRWSTFRFMRKQVDLLSNVHRGMTAHGFS
jgi:hypothetical protein